MEKTNLAYREGQRVQVYDTAKRRWYSGTLEFKWRTSLHELGEAWEVLLDNGNKGQWDLTHMRPMI